MAKQDGWKPHETQPEPLLPISSGLGAHYRRSQEFAGSFRPVGPRRVVKAATCTILGQKSLDPQRDAFSRPPLGTFNVIFAAPGRTGSYPFRVMSVALLSTEDSNSEPKRARIKAPLVLGFSADDKIRTIQPHDDALVFTLKIRGMI